MQTELRRGGQGAALVLILAALWALDQTRSQRRETPAEQAEALRKAEDAAVDPYHGNALDRILTPAVTDRLMYAERERRARDFLTGRR